MSFLADIKIKTAFAKEKELGKKNKLYKSVISKIKKNIEAQASIGETSFTWKPSSVDESKVLTMIETYFKNEGFTVRTDEGYAYFTFSSSICEATRVITLKISWEE